MCFLIITGRPWPVIFGLGAGLGMGYANCQQEFNEPFLVKAEKIFVSIYVFTLENILAYICV